MVLGHRLKNVTSIDYDMKEKHVTLNLQYVSYRLQIDDQQKLRELIQILQMFTKSDEELKEEINVPKFYVEGKR
jgi:hypothetical protein